ncbi:Smr/MutS family protein [Apibacter sp. HY039]|uniref:Smr/MutS family protein n=1 Tax=Apibacter sp. HY039 TaxID=2501476 RepID=UPI000FEBEA87|nr:Smr/MutS family protein [Apibacter sp. HY039]
MFKSGDKVKVVDEEGVFVIKQLHKGTAVLEDQYGFETEYSLSKILPYISVDETVIDVEIRLAKNKTDKAKNKLVNSKEECREIDLHIGHLMDSIKNVQPHQMLQKQLNTAKYEIDRARKDQLKKLILIHGKGKGVLKEEIYKMLKTMDRIEFFEADIMKYRFGAVEIRFY